jgi:arylsulfatase A-like enzyme
METARKLHGKLEAYLSGEPRRPVFLYLHYRDVHGPYVPPPPFHATFLPEGVEAIPDLIKKTRFKRKRDVAVFVSQYDGEILYTDGWLRSTLALMAQGGLARNNTVIVISADHGEEFQDAHPGDPGGHSHGRTLHLEQIHVPLVLLVPGLGPRRVEPWVELTDVTPTLLEAVGIDPQGYPSLEGRSLLPLARGAGEPRPFVYAGGSHGRATLIADDWKLERLSQEIRGNRKAAFASVPAEHALAEQLFDLGGDPRETRDLLAQQPEQAQRLRKLLAEHEAALPASRARALPLDAETRERLEALGYL